MWRARAPIQVCHIIVGRLKMSFMIANDKLTNNCLSMHLINTRSIYQPSDQTPTEQRIFGINQNKPLSAIQMQCTVHTHTHSPWMWLSETAARYRSGTWLFAFLSILFWQWPMCHQEPHTAFCENVETSLCVWFALKHTTQIEIVCVYCPNMSIKYRVTDHATEWERANHKADRFPNSTTIIKRTETKC